MICTSCIKSFNTHGAHYDGIDGTQWKFPLSCVSYTHHMSVLLSTLWRCGMPLIFTSNAQVSNLRGVLYPNPGFRQEKVQSGARAGDGNMFRNQQNNKWIKIDKQRWLILNIVSQVRAPVLFSTTHLGCNMIDLYLVVDRRKLKLPPLALNKFVFAPPRFSECIMKSLSKPVDTLFFAIASSRC